MHQQESKETPGRQTGEGRNFLEQAGGEGADLPAHSVTLTRPEAERERRLCFSSAFFLLPPPPPVCHCPSHSDLRLPPQSQLNSHDYQPYLPRAAHALLYVPQTHARQPSLCGPTLRNCRNVNGREPRANCTSLPTAANWGDARYRVLKSYREWLRAVSDPNCSLRGTVPVGHSIEFDIYQSPSRPRTGPGMDPDRCKMQTVQGP